MRFIILIILVTIFIISGCNQIPPECTMVSENRISCPAKVVNIFEEYKKDGCQDKITEITYIFTLDSSIPMLSGYFSLDSCSLHSNKPYIEKINDSKPEQVTRLGECLEQAKVYYVNNSFKITFSEKTLNNIAINELESPFYVALPEHLSDLSISGEDVKKEYKLNYSLVYDKYDIIGEEISMLNPNLDTSQHYNKISDLSYDQICRTYYPTITLSEDGWLHVTNLAGYREMDKKTSITIKGIDNQNSNVIYNGDAWIPKGSDGQQYNMCALAKEKSGKYSVEVSSQYNKYKVTENSFYFDYEKYCVN